MIFPPLIQSALISSKHKIMLHVLSPSLYQKHDIVQYNITFFNNDIYIFITASVHEGTSAQFMDMRQDENLTELYFLLNKNVFQFYKT